MISLLSQLRVPGTKETIDVSYNRINVFIMLFTLNIIGVFDFSCVLFNFPVCKVQFIFSSKRYISISSKDLISKHIFLLHRDKCM